MRPSATNNGPDCPLETGLAFLPMTGLTFFVTLLAPRVAARFGPRVPMAAGQFLRVVGLRTLCVTVAGSPIVLLALLALPVGLGRAPAIPTINSTRRSYYV